MKAVRKPVFAVVEGTVTCATDSKMRPTRDGEPTEERVQTYKVSVRAFIMRGTVHGEISGSLLGGKFSPNRLVDSRVVFNFRGC